MNREKVIFFASIAAVLILMVVYIIFAFAKSDKQDLAEDSFLSPQYNLEGTKYQYKSRVEALTKNRYEAPKRENPLRFDFLEEETKEKTAKKDSSEKKQKAKIVSQAKQQLNHSQKKEPEKAPTPKTKAPIQKETPNQEPEQLVSVSYRFSSQTNQSSPAQNSTLREVNLWAQLNEKSIIRDNSNQVFLLEKEAHIAGKDFPANSKLYTTAQVQADYIDIHVHRIKDINTLEEYPVDMYAINESRTRGIKYQGRTNRESDEASRNMLSQATRSVYRKYQVDGVAQAAGDGLEEIIGREKIEVPIAKGYRLIFIENSAK